MQGQQVKRVMLRRRSLQRRRIRLDAPAFFQLRVEMSCRLRVRDKRASPAVLFCPGPVPTSASDSHLVAGPRTRRQIVGWAAVAGLGTTIATITGLISDPRTQSGRCGRRLAVEPVSANRAWRAAIALTRRFNMQSSLW